MADLEDVASGKVVEPVRVFVGRASAPTVEERVDVAMSEMERFGGFEREAVLMVIPTGTGWINEQLVQPVEYFHDGDVATVTVQYSHLPSPLAFVRATIASTMPVAMAPIPLIANPTRQPGSRRRRWRLAIPACESVNEVNTPIA